MKFVTEIIWGIIVSVILIAIGISVNVSVLDVIGGFGVGFYLGKLSIFIEMEKKYG